MEAVSGGGGLKRTSLTKAGERLSGARACPTEEAAEVAEEAEDGGGLAEGALTRSTKVAATYGFLDAGSTACSSCAG